VLILWLGGVMAGHAASTYAVPMVNGAEEAPASSRLARVCVLRAPSKIGKMATYEIYDNQEELVHIEKVQATRVSPTRLGSLSPGTHLLYERPPGPATIRVFKRGPSVDLMAEAGKTYYLELKLSTFGAKLSQLDETAGAAARQQSRLAAQPAAKVAGYDVLVPRHDRSADVIRFPFLGGEILFPAEGSYHRVYERLLREGHVVDKAASGYRIVVKPKEGGAPRTYFTQNVAFSVPEIVVDHRLPKASQEKMRLTEVGFAPLFGAVMQFKVTTCRRGGLGSIPCEFEGALVTDSGSPAEVEVTIGEGLPATEFFPAVTAWLRAP